MSRWIGGVSRQVLRAAFAEYFGVSDEHCEVLVVLYGRPNEWTTVPRLQVLINSHRPPKRQAIYERIRVLRDVMEAESIESGGQGHDTGYRLSEVGFVECRQALLTMADALRREGPERALPNLDALIAEDDNRAPLRLAAPRPE